MCMMLKGSWRQRDAASIDVIVTGGGGGGGGERECVCSFMFVCKITKNMHGLG